MKKILTSTWFAAVVGVVAFLVTAVLLWKPEPPAAPEGSTTNETASATEPEAPAEEDPLVAQDIVAPLPPPEPVSLKDIAEPGSLQFNNPEVMSLLNELKKEKSALLDKERQLNDLRDRLVLEKQHIGMITQEMLNAKASLQRALTNQMVIYEQAEERRLKELAVIYTNMVPSSAVLILDKMNVDDVARILQYMREGFKAAILENFATNANAAVAQKATEISERLRKLAQPPDLPPIR